MQPTDRLQGSLNMSKHAPQNPDYYNIKSLDTKNSTLYTNSQFMLLLFLLLHCAFLRVTDYHTPTNALLYTVLV